MIETAICDSAKLEFMSGIHLPGDRYKIALYVEGTALNSKTTAYLPLQEVEGMGYEAGGKRITPAIQLVAGEARMLFVSPVTWENASISARGALIYNASKGNKALATFDFGKDVVSTNGPFEVTIPNEGAIILS